MTAYIAAAITAHVVDTDLDDGRAKATVQIRYGNTVVGTYEVDGYPFLFEEAEVALEEFVADRLRKAFGDT
jgi:hypothetical protein